MRRRVRGSMNPQRELFPAIPAEVTARIQRVLVNPAASPCAKAVLTRICDVAGRSHAVGIGALQQYWRICRVKVYSDREIKAAVKELVEEWRVPVGSARSAPAGYFLLVSP